MALEITDFTYPISSLCVGCPDLIWERQCALYVDNLSPTGHLPKPILSSGVVDSNVATLLHPVRNRAAILAILKPLAESPSPHAAAWMPLRVTATGLPIRSLSLSPTGFFALITKFSCLNAYARSAAIAPLPGQVAATTGKSACHACQSPGEPLTRMTRAFSECRPHYSYSGLFTLGDA